MRRLFAAAVLFLLPTLAQAQGAMPPAFRGNFTFNATFSPDNAFDVGAVAASRPRNIYAGTGIFSPALTVSGLTATRCTFAGVGGLLSDDADCTFSGSRLTVTDLTAGTATVSALTSGRVTFAGTSGLLADDSDLTFSGSRTTATDLTVTNFPTFSAGTNTRVPFFGASGVLSDDADLTFVTDRLTADKLTVTTGPFFVNPGTAANPGIASTAATTTGFLLGAINYSIRSGVEWVGMSGSGSTGSIRICTSGTAGCGTQETIEATTAGIRYTDLILTAATMTAETTGRFATGTSSYTWTNAQVVALGATTAGDITVATLPAKTQIVDAILVITGAAVGPTTVTVSCGDAIAGTPFINYIVASDAKAAANTVYGDAAAERGTSIDVEYYYLPSYTATTLITCHFISTGANLSTVTGSTGRLILTHRLLP